MSTSFIRGVSSVFEGSLLSYGQVFFSRSYPLSIFVLLLTFVFYHIGMAGFVSLFSALLFSTLLGLNQDGIRSGYYGYNALLVGLGLGSYYSLNLPLIFLLVLIGFFTLILHLLFEGWFSKYKVPVLSLPFVFSLWVGLLASRNLPFIQLSEHGIFLLNEIYRIGGVVAVQTYDYLNYHFFPVFWQQYFASLSSIFFLDQALVGVVIFLGLLLYSRIATTLSLLGFSAAYGFLILMGYDVESFTNFYVGYNFVLTAIALGGVLLVPSVFSYLWVVLLTPLVTLLALGLELWLGFWNLPILSLPFNVVTIMFVYSLYYRQGRKKLLAFPPVQHWKPESNLYTFLNVRQRFGSYYPVQLFLPFWGEWTVWQGHHGKFTHQPPYQHGLDFVIIVDGKTHKNEGWFLTDYYCYDKLVLSPGYGVVVKVIDGIEDNPPGQVNTQYNWGNTIVIRHGDFLYTQLSHLKPFSIKVKEGDHVVPGQPLATVGNSGRSPQPHLHFQVQTQPYVGSTTIEYPFSRYILKQNHQSLLKSFSVPAEKDVVLTIQINSALKKAFTFYPLQQFEIHVSDQEIKKTEILSIDVGTNMANESYFYSCKDHSTAFFMNDGVSFQFLSFYGKKKSPLYWLYLSAYRVEFSEIGASFVIKDTLPLHQIFSPWILFFHDFVAPFFRFLHATYEFNSIQSHGEIMKVQSTIRYFVVGKIIKTIRATIFVQDQMLDKILVQSGNKKSLLKFVYKNRYE